MNPYLSKKSGKVSSGNPYDAVLTSPKQFRKQQKLNNKAKSYERYARRAIESPALPSLLNSLRKKAEKGDEDARVRFNTIQSVRGGDKQIKPEKPGKFEQSLSEALRPRNKQEKKERRQSSTAIIQNKNRLKGETAAEQTGSKFTGFLSDTANEITSGLKTTREIARATQQEVINNRFIEQKSKELDEVRKLERSGRISSNEAKSRRKTISRELEDLNTELRTSDLATKDRVELAGAAAESSLLVGGLAAGLTSNAAKAVVKPGIKQIAKTALGEAILGAGEGAAYTARSRGKKATGGDYAKNIALFGAGGAALDIVPRINTLRKTKAAKEVADYAAKASKTTPEAAEAVSRIKQAADNKAVEEEVKFSAAARRKGKLTSRTKQFSPKTYKSVIDEVEESNSKLLGSGPGQRQNNTDTYAEAIERGRYDLADYKAGDKIDAVDVARAHMTMGEELELVSKSLTDGKGLEEAKAQLGKTLEGYQRLTSEPGRALQIQNTFGKDTLRNAEEAMKYITSIKGKPNKKQTEIFNDMLEKTVKSAKDSKEPGWRLVVRALEEYATAAKLTSPVTHIRNILGNTSTFLQRAVTEGVAIGTGAARKGTSLKAIKGVLGTSAGYKAATKKAWDIMKDSLLLRESVGQGERAVKEGFQQAITSQKLGIKNKTAAKAVDKIGAAIRLPFNMLQAADEFGKTVLRDSKMYQDAVELAYKEGFTGKALDNRVAELIEAPTEAMIRDANEEALTYTFQHELGKPGKAMEKLVSDIPGGRFFIPFIRTPTNIIKFQAKNSALGLPTNLVSAIKKRGTREGDEALARMVIGGTLSAGTFQWARENRDKITGAAPTEPVEKDAFYESGKQPFSVKIGDRWVSYQNLQPFGLYMLHAKALDDVLEGKLSGKDKDREAASIAANMVGIAAQGLLELPFVQGVSNIMEAFSDPEYSGEKFVGRTLSGFVPNALRDVRLYKDSVVRAPESIKEQIMDMIPGLSDNLKSRKDSFGEAIQRKGTPIGRSVGRVAGTKAQEPEKELKLLAAIGKETNYYPAAGSPVYGERVSEDEYEKFDQEFKKSLKQVISKNYKELKNAKGNDKQDLLSVLASEARQKARDRLGY